MRIHFGVVALATILFPCAAAGQNLVPPGPRSAPCFEVPGDQSSRCIREALGLVRWRLDEFIKQRDRERSGIAIVDQAFRTRMDSLRVVQQHWQAYVEGHCRWLTKGMDSETFKQDACLVDAYDRRLADILPTICEREVATCPQTEEFERSHSRH